VNLTFVSQTLDFSALLLSADSVFLFVWLFL
jgi:hypothetical protein